MKFRLNVACLFSIFGILACADSSAQVENIPADLYSNSEVNALGEEILDLAILQCQQGNFIQSGYLLREVLSQLDPPQNLRTLIEKILEGQCGGGYEYIPKLELKLSQGYDSNVTQGITATTLNIGTPKVPVNLIIDNSYRVRPSSYTEFFLQRNLKISESMHLMMRGNFRNYAQVPEYDQVQSGILLRGNLQWDSRNILWMLEKSDMWLQGNYYYSGWQGVIQVPWKSQPQWQWAGLLQQLTYKKQPNQNSNVYQLALQRSLRWAQTDIYMSAGWQWDRALAARAGGDRQGPLLVVQGNKSLEKWVVSGRVAYTQWRSSNDFLPGLLDFRRRNRLIQWTLQADYPIDDNQKLQIGFYQRISLDNIALYENRGIGLNIGWSLRF